MPNLAATLLLIEPDDAKRAHCTQQLQALGYAVLALADSPHALELPDGQLPDALLCARNAQPQDAFALLQQLGDGLDGPPLIVLATQHDPADALQALRLGAVDYLVQPGEPLAWQQALQRALLRSRLLTDNRRYRTQLEESNQQLQANLQLLQDDQNAGRQVQLNMLPESPWQSAAIHADYRIRPSLYLSGDWVDYLRLDEQRVVFYLADVSGHGASSAFVTLLLKFMTTRLLHDARRAGRVPEFSPAEVLGHINRNLLNCQLGKHVTLIGGIIDESRNCLTYSVAGHLPLPLLQAGGEVRYLPGRGFPLGLFAEAEYQDQQIELPAAFSLALMSDGVFELLPQSSLKDKEAALAQLFDRAQGDLAGFEHLLGLAGRQQIPDDVALLVLGRSPA